MVTVLSQIPFQLVGNTEANERSDVPLYVLTSGMRAGSDEDWDEFHRRYYLPLLRFTASRSLFPHEAEDIVQQVYLRVARHIKPFRSETEFWRWLACVARCVVVDHQRGVRRRVLLLERFAHWHSAQFLAAAAPLAAADTNGLVLEALAKLPAEDARLLRLKYYEGWSVQQLADDCGITLKALENRLARLRQNLREAILRTE